MDNPKIVYAIQALSNIYQLLSRSIRGRCLVWESAQGDEYQLQLPSIGFVPQVLFEVEAIHMLVDKSKRVCLSRIDPQEWYYIHISVVKEAAHANFIVKPL